MGWGGGLSEGGATGYLASASTYVSMRVLINLTSWARPK